MKPSANPMRGRSGARTFLASCGPVTGENYAEHVANAVYDAALYGWSRETLAWLRAELSKRVEVTS